MRFSLLIILTLITSLPVWAQSNWKEYLQNGNAKQMAHQYEDAIDLYTKALEMDSLLDVVYYNRGMAYAAIEQWGLSKKDAQKAIFINESNAGYHALLGKVYGGLGLPENAILSYIKALELDAGNLEYLMERASLLIKLERYKEALADYTFIAESGEQQQQDKEFWVRLYAERGIAYSQTAQYELALKDYERVLIMDAKHKETLNSQALTYYLMQDYEKAQEVYIRLLELEKTNASYFFNAGLNDFMLENTEMAIKRMDNAIHLDANFVDAYSNRGYIKSKRGDLKGALVDYNKALELDDNQVITYIRRGYAQTDLRQYEKAIADFNRVIENYPTYAVYGYNNRAKAYLEQGEWDLAEKDLTVAMEMDSLNAYVYCNWGRLADLQKKAEQANAAFEKALELGPNEPEILYYTSLFFYQQKAYKKSVEGWAKLKEKDAFYKSKMVKKWSKKAKKAYLRDL